MREKFHSFSTLSKTADLPLDSSKEVRLTLSQFEKQTPGSVSPAGIEPATSRSSDERSTN